MAAFIRTQEQRMQDALKDLKAGQIRSIKQAAIYCYDSTKDS